MRLHQVVIVIHLSLLSLSAHAEIINVNVPTAVADAISVYRAQCSDHDNRLDLDGDEVLKLWTDEGEEAYLIRASFTCGDLGHLWCGSRGCPLEIVINNRSYETNRLLNDMPNRISRTADGVVKVWTPDGYSFQVK